jgi:hypothetical protein
MNSLVLKYVVVIISGELFVTEGNSCGSPHPRKLVAGLPQAFTPPVRQTGPNHIDRNRVYYLYYKRAGIC